MTIVFLMILSVLLLNRTACATIYYLSAGTTGGDEDGSSLANAWKTVSDITGLAAGDTVYCAGTGYEYLTVADSVAYVVIPDSTWVIDGGDSLTYGIYSSGKSGVVIDGATIKKLRKTAEAYGIYAYVGSGITVKNCDISEVYYATNPMIGGDTHAWEVQRGYGIYFRNIDKPKIFNNTIRDVGGVVIMVMSGDGVDIGDIEIYNNEYTNFNRGIAVACSDSTATISGAKIYNNYGHDHNNYYVCTPWHRDFVHIYARANTISHYIENIEIYNNYFEDLVNATLGGTASILLNYNCTKFKIHHNVFYNNPGNNSIDISPFSTSLYSIYGGHEIYNNTSYGGLGGIYINGTTDNKIKNNIFLTKNAVISIGQEVSKTGLVIDNNIIHKIPGGTSSYVYLKPKWINTHASLIAAGYDSNGYDADPLFVGGTGVTAFQLQAGSPAIDTGDTLGFTADALGDTIPQGSAPEIGAFEYNTDPTPPSDLTNTVNLPKHSVHTFVDNSSDEEGFQVMINGVVTDSLAANTETFSIDNQTPGTTYNVQIRAYKGDYLSGATVVNFTAPRYRLGRVR